MAINVPLIEFWPKFIIESRSSVIQADQGRVQEHQGKFETSFVDGNMIYSRSFMGVHRLIGKEILFVNENPVWGLSFFGTDLKDDLRQEQVFQFLNISLALLPPKDDRLDYSKWFTKHEFIDNSEGGFSRFNGELHVLLNNENIYKINYFGGLIIGDHKAQL